MTTKVPAELSSTPGISDSSNATAITIDSSENVGIGSTSPDSHLHLESSGATSFRIRTTSSSSEPQMIMIDGAGDYFSMQKVDRGMTFKPQGAEEVRIDADGLKFNGDTAAANALDDYEEGTWTPQITASAGSAGTAAYSNQMGRYTKIGNKVFFEFQVVMTNKGSWSAYTRVLGFPFTITSGGLTAFAIARFPDDTIGANMIAGELQPSSTYCFFLTGSRLDTLHDISNVDTGYYLIGAGHYTI